MCIKKYKKFKAFYKRYGFYGIIRLSIDVLFSRFVFGKVRIIRRPFYMRGKKYIKIGESFTSGVGLRIDAFPIAEKICIEIGNNVQVNDYVHISAVDSVKIGNNVLVASKVFITDHNHGFYGLNNIHDNPNIPPLKRKLSYIPVEIGDNVWLGESVMVLPGVKIGKGSIIGAMSVVTKEIPSFCIAVGCPAAVIKKYDFTTNKWKKV